MQCKNCCWFVKIGAILTAAVIAQAQPPTIDSLYVFLQEQGRITLFKELPDGDALVAGSFWEDGRYQYQVRRMTQEREFVWSTSVMRDSLEGIYSMTVSDDHILLLGAKRVRIDSTSYTTRDVAMCFDQDGDSLWSTFLTDSVNFTQLTSAAPLADGGFLVSGGKSHIIGTFVIWDVWIVRLSVNGEIIAERFYGQDRDDWCTNIVRVGDDAYLFAMASSFNSDGDLSLIWVNSSGDSLRGITHRIPDHLFSSSPSRLFVSQFGIDVFWQAASVGDWDLRWHLIRLSEEGAIILDESAVASRDLFVGFVPRVDGMLTFGNSNYWLDIQDLHWARFGQNGYWHYDQTIQMPDTQYAYDLHEEPDGRLTLLGAQLDNTHTLRPAIFYFSAEGNGSYLYSLPQVVDFGIVPIDEAVVRSVQLAPTADSAVTLTDYEIPLEYAVDPATPVMILPHHFQNVQIAFRPTERRLYRDTLFVTSTALNERIAILLQGEAPFPVCVPDTNNLVFHWILIGDTSHADLTIRNAGTLPLHIDSLIVPLPFWCDNPEPHEVGVGETIQLHFAFAYDSAGVYQHSIFLHSDEPETPDTVRLECRVLPGHAGAELPNGIPHEFRLHAAYPNPFNASAVIRFELPKTQFVKLELFDITGRLVKEVLEHTFDAGVHQVVIDGAGLASGIYFANLEAGEFHAVQKLVLLK